MAKTVSQISAIEEREAHINVNYFTKTAQLYTNNSTVINRMARKGHEHIGEELFGGKVYSRTYEVPLAQIGKLLQVTLLK